MSHTLQLLLLGCLMVTVMSLGWLWQRHHRNAGIVDVLWAAGVGVGAVLMSLTGGGAFLPRALVAILGGSWSLRLALFLWRRVRNESEDGRYRALREHWQDHQGKFFLFFMAQALLVLLFALPFMAAAGSPDPASKVTAMLAVAIWLASVGLESVADRQLAAFRATSSNRGRTCRVGLWRYSRHPNYFFEWLHWFSYVALAWNSPIGWLSLSGPVVMFVFLRWISGVPYTEAQALRSRGDDYRAYQQNTPMLFPWFPRASTGDGP